MSRNLKEDSVGCACGFPMNSLNLSSSCMYASQGPTITLFNKWIKNISAKICLAVYKGLFLEPL